jgi:hypothetical protein
MTKVTLPKYAKLIPKLDGTAYDTVAIRKEFEDYFQNVREVLISAAMIEEALKCIVTVYFVSEEGKRGMFEDLVTHASFFMFENSRRIALEVLREKQPTDDNKLENLDKLVRKVIDYRNQLIHGTPAMVHDKLMLSFFKIEKKDVEINEEYWKKLNQTFWDCHNLLHEIVPTV